MKRSCASVLLLLSCAGAHRHLEPRFEQAGRDPKAPEIVVLIGSSNALYEQALSAFREQVKAPLSAFMVPDDPELLMRSVRARRPGLIFAVGPRAALLARRHTPDIPLLFTMVVNHRQHPDLIDQTDVMGVALEPPPAQEFVQFKLLLPSVSRALTFYTPRESEPFVEEAKGQLAALGIALEAVPVRSIEGLAEAFDAHAPGADAIWLFNDRAMANQASFELLERRAIDEKIPLLTSLSEDYAKAGALMSVAVDFRSIGSQSAAMANLFLDQRKSAEDLGVQAPAGTALSLNRTTAERLGIQVPDDAVQFIDRFFPDESAAAEPAKTSVTEKLPAPLVNLFVEVAAKRAQPTSEAPAIVTVYTAQHIRELGFRTLGELLDWVTAVQRVQLPNAETALVVRGFASENGVAVLIDGVPVLDPITGAFAHYDMPLTGLKRVEVQRGPGSALYGGNAQAAVINLVSADAKDSAAMLSARLLTGGDAVWASGEGKYGQLSIAGAANRFVSPAQKFDSDGTSERNDLFDDDVPQSLVDPRNPAGFDARSEPLTAGTAHLRYVSPWGLILRGTAVLREVTPLINPGPGGTQGRHAIMPEGAFQRRDTLALIDARYQTDVTQDVEFFASATYVLNHRKQGGQLTGPLRLRQDRNQDGVFDEWPEGMIERYEYAVHTAAIEARIDVELPHDNLFTAGVALSHSAISNLRYRANFENSPVGPSIGLAPVAGGDVRDLTGEQFVLPDMSRLSLGVFAQDIYDVTDWLVLVGGLRFDFVLDQSIISEALLRQDMQCGADSFGLCQPLFNALEDGKRYVQLSPRLAAIVRLPYSLRLKVLWGAAFTPPPLNALSNQTFTESLSRRASNPLLKSLTSQTLELALQMNADRRLTWELAGFWIRTQDEVVFDPRAATFLNNAHRQILGGELGFAGELPVAGPDFALLYGAGVSFQYTFALQDQLVGIGSDIYPTLLLKGRLGVRLFEWMTVSALISRTSRSRREVGDERDPVGAYVLGDLRVSAHDPNSGFSFGFFAKNLFDERYADPTLQASGLVNDYPRGGRTLEAVIEYEF